MSVSMDDSLPTRASLLSRIRDVGNDASWREFFERYRGFIYGVARRKGLGHEDAEEVLQDTVVSVAKGLPRFVYRPEESSFRGWLTTITVRRVADQLRRASRRVGTLPLVEEPEGAATWLGAFDAHAALWDEEWAGNLCRVALDRLRLVVSPRDFQVFDWTELRGHRNQDAAAAFGLSTVLVRVIRFRVRRRLDGVVRGLEREPWPRGVQR
jgi:RNA polymerase sigma factor (sigma-70 family)